MKIIQAVICKNCNQAKDATRPFIKLCELKLNHVSSPNQEVTKAYEKDEAFCNIKCLLKYIEYQYTGVRSDD